MPFNEEKLKNLQVSSEGTLVGEQIRLNLIEGDNISLDGLNNGTANITISLDTTQYTDEMTQDAVGNILTDSSTIDFTYNDAGNSITASVIQSALDHVNVLNKGTNTHTQIDTHITDSSIHLNSTSVKDAVGNILTDSSTIDFAYTSPTNITGSVIQSGLSHTNFLNIGTNTHTQIDTHIADSTIHGRTIEELQDNLGTSFLQEGFAIDLNYNDSSNILTVTPIIADLTLDLFPGPLTSSKGGTDNSSTPTNGQLLIGKTSTHTLNKTTLIGGTGTYNAYVTNGAGTITISADAFTPGSQQWSWKADDTTTPSPAPTTSNTGGIAIGEDCSTTSIYSFSLGNNVDELNNTADNTFAVGKNLTVLKGDNSTTVGRAIIMNGDNSLVIRNPNTEAEGTTASGTISSSGTSVTGSSTQFTTQLFVGGRIIASGQERIIATITDDTHLTVTVAFSPNVTSVSFTRQTGVVKCNGDNVVSVASYNNKIESNRTMLFNVYGTNNKTVGTASTDRNALYWQGSSMSTFAGITPQSFGIYSKHTDVAPATIAEDYLISQVYRTHDQWKLGKELSRHGLSLIRKNILHLLSGDGTDSRSNFQMMPLKGSCSAGGTVVLTSDGLSASSTSNAIGALYNSRAIAFSGMATGIDVVTGDVASYSFNGVIKVNGGGTSSLLTSNVTVIQEDDSRWGLALTLSSGRLDITATGDSSNITHWSGYIKTTGVGVTQVF